MPNKQIVTIEEVSEARRVLARTLRDFRDFPCEATLTLLIIRLFETIQLICSYEEGKCANYNCVKNRIFSEAPTAFTYMRNSLVHEMKNIEKFNKFIQRNLTTYGKEAFNQVYELCFEENYDLYSEIIEFLNNFEIMDNSEEIENRESVGKENVNKESIEVKENDSLNTKASGVDAFLKK